MSGDGQARFFIRCSRYHRKTGKLLWDRPYKGPFLDIGAAVKIVRELNQDSDGWEDYYLSKEQEEYQDGLS